MVPNTHLAIDHSLCGAPQDLSEGHATARLETTAAMAVDVQGLVHGGFVFGLADHAAMLGGGAERRRGADLDGRREALAGATEGVSDPLSDRRLYGKRHQRVIPEVAGADPAGAMERMAARNDGAHCRRAHIVDAQ